MRRRVRRKKKAEQTSRYDIYVGDELYSRFFVLSFIFLIIFLDEFLVHQQSIMISNDNETSTDTVTSESNTKSSMSPSVSLANPTGENQTVQTTDNDQHNGVIAKESQDNQLSIAQNEDEQQQDEDNDDEFIRITAAHQMLTEGKS